MKYLNNVSPEPLVMATKEDEEQAKFLAFSQHVQYWKTKKHMFVSEYQGKQPMLACPYNLITNSRRWQYITE